MASGMFGARISKEHKKEATTTIIILALYFSDPFPMFLVRDHFSCKYAPPHVASPTCKLAFI